MCGQGDGDDVLQDNRIVIMFYEQNDTASPR